MRNALGLLILLALGLRAGAAPGSERVSMLDALDDLQAKGELQRALVRVSFALNRFPNDVSFHTRYQDIQRSLGHEAQVREEYRRRSLEHRSVRDLCLYARLLKGEAAIRVYKIALRRAPDFFWAHYGIGVVYMRQGEIEKARDHLERAQTLEPREPAPKIRLGQLYERTNRPDKAFDQYQLAAVIAPKAADPLFHQVFALMAQKRMHKAEEVAQNLLGHPSPDAIVLAHVALGALKVHRGDRVGAVKEYARAVRRSGTLGPYALVLLADTLTDLGRYDEAQGAYARALAADEDNLRARTGLGYLLYRRGDLKRADAEFARAAAQARKGDARNAAEPLFYRGVVAEEEGRLRNALYYYGKAIEADERTADYHLARAALCERMGHPERALRSYLDAARYDPGDALALLQAGLIEADLKHPKRALAHFDEAIARDAKLLDAYLAAGSICQDRLSRPKKARAYYEAYVKQGGKDERVLAWLDELGK